MLITTVGAVISVRDVGDNDRFITVLSPDMGLVEISVRAQKSWVRAIMPQRSFLPVQSSVSGSGRAGITLTAASL